MAPCTRRPDVSGPRGRVTDHPDASCRPTRVDDTTVITGGRPATLEQVEALIAADLAERSNDG